MFFQYSSRPLIISETLFQEANNNRVSSAFLSNITKEYNFVLSLATHHVDILNFQYHKKIPLSWDEVPRYLFCDPCYFQMFCPCLYFSVQRKMQHKKLIKNRNKIKQVQLVVETIDRLFSTG